MKYAQCAKTTLFFNNCQALLLHSVFFIIYGSDYVTIFQCNVDYYFERLILQRLTNKSYSLRKLLKVFDNKYSIQQFLKFVNQILFFKVMKSLTNRQFFYFNKVIITITYNLMFLYKFTDHSSNHEISTITFFCNIQNQRLSSLFNLITTWFIHS